MQKRLCAILFPCAKVSDPRVNLTATHFLKQINFMYVLEKAYFEAGRVYHVLSLYLSTEEVGKRN